MLKLLLGRQRFLVGKRRAQRINVVRPQRTYRFIATTFQRQPVVDLVFIKGTLGNAQLRWQCLLYIPLPPAPSDAASDARTDLLRAPLQSGSTPIPLQLCQ